MPKAARRTSGPRAEPYPTITNKSSPPKTASKKKTPLTEKSEAETNISKNSPTSKKSPKAPKTTEKKETTSSPTQDLSKPTTFLDQRLDNEDEDGNVPIFDACSTIRKNINTLLGAANAKEENGNPNELTKDGKKKPWTKASFVRAIGGCTTKSLDTFLKAKKIMGGAESPVYPRAYRFFEQRRVWEGKKKTKGRLDMESE